MRDRAAYGIRARTGVRRGSTTRVGSRRRADTRESVSGLGEFGLIERLLDRFTVRNRRSVLVGPGDDAAVVSCGRGERLVLTTDMLVEGTHFRLEWSCPEALGFKSVTANLSDVAAMGGAPVGIVVSLGIPAALPVRAVDGLYRGVSSALEQFGGELLGGDTVRSDRITVSVAAVGVLVGDAPLLRSGARKGDFVCVTGSLGRPELGLRILERCVRRHRGSRSSAMLAWADREIEDFRRKLPAGMGRDGYNCVLGHLMPSPRMREAQLLARMGKSGPSAMMDLSDGLSSDLNQIAAASGVHIRIYEKRIPVHPSVVRTARRLAVSTVEVAVASGEEYELIMTVPPSRLKSLTRQVSRVVGTRLTVIGEVLDAGFATKRGASSPGGTVSRRGDALGHGPGPVRGSVSVVSRRGRQSTLTHKGFRHF